MIDFLAMTVDRSSFPFAFCTAVQAGTAYLFDLRATS